MGEEVRAVSLRCRWSVEFIRPAFAESAPFWRLRSDTFLSGVSPPSCSSTPMPLDRRRPRLERSKTNCCSTNSFSFRNSRLRCRGARLHGMLQLCGHHTGAGYVCTGPDESPAARTFRKLDVRL